MSLYLATDLLPLELAYRFSETFMKKLVGRTDIEDALQRLETATVEEVQMAAAEALKAIHKVRDVAREIHHTVRDVREMIRGGGDRVKGIDDKAVIGAQKVLILSSLSPMLILLRVEKTERQMASDHEAIHAETPKTTKEANNRIQCVGNMAQGCMCDTLEGASEGAGNSDSVQNPIKRTGAGGVGGAHIICNLSSGLLPSVPYI